MGSILEYITSEGEVLEKRWLEMVQEKETARDIADAVEAVLTATPNAAVQALLDRYKHHDVPRLMDADLNADVDSLGRAVDSIIGLMNTAVRMQKGGVSIAAEHRT